MGGCIHEGKALVSSGKVPYDPASWAYSLQLALSVFPTGPVCPWEPSVGPDPHDTTKIG